MRYCGFSEYYHDAALAIIEEDGTVSFASHAERFDKKKHSPLISSDLWKYSNRDDYLVFYEDWDRKHQLSGELYLFDETGKMYNNAHNGQTRESLDRIAYLNADNFSVPVKSAMAAYDEHGNHHNSHVANALYTRPWSDTTDTVCVSIDGVGEIETVQIMTPDFKVVYTEHLPKSIGLIYSFITQGMGLKALDDEYVVMGLAAYGEPKYVDLLLEWYNAFEDMNPDVGVVPLRNKESKYWNLNTEYKRRVEEIQKQLGRGDLMKHADMAASCQAAFEIVAERIMRIARRYGSKLVYSGGCAQNVTFNSKLWDIFDNVHIAISPTDAGSSLGCAAKVWARDTGGDRLKWTPYLGYDMGCTINPKEVVDHLLKDEYCGIASGKAEWGPRALGNRSLIADPRKDVKNTVNQVKRRQKFRPFAPAILEEFVDEYFEGPTNEYMQYTSKALHDHKSVSHVDGTARVQVVRKDCSSIFRQIIEEFYEKTGCPMLLNTSLNIRGRPMVNDHHDAELFESKYDVKVFT